MTQNSRGLIQVYTGNGKGKTTAALGLAMRAVGQDLRVAFIPFIKGIPAGEHAFVARYHPFDIIQFSAGDSFTKSKGQLKIEAQQTLACAEKEMLSGKYDLLILDEILVAISKDLIATEQVLQLLDNKPDAVDIVLTGRNAPPQIMLRADLVTEMLNIKHPYNGGGEARKGIEY